MRWTDHDQMAHHGDGRLATKAAARTQLIVLDKEVIELLPKLISRRVQPERRTVANVVTQSTRGRYCVRFHTAAKGT